MPYIDDETRINHIIEASEKAIALCADRQRSDLDSDETLALALVRLLEIVGEASKGISENIRRNNPQIPWRQITGTRDRLIHGYFDVDLDIVWQIITEDLPALVIKLKHISL